MLNPRSAPFTPDELIRLPRWRIGKPIALPVQPIIVPIPVAPAPEVAAIAEKVAKAPSSKHRGLLIGLAIIIVVGCTIIYCQHQQQKNKEDNDQETQDVNNSVD
ncbi:hypothetical protein EPD60_07490 [Flaviaesturariibacter flavus]|uniref:Uncharacterized protein n=1 Tax=Flaviaesturariibacter flavus TaxID=2502780 RepID=A0A4R1BH36_9BACT|nr:hypothetical protein [Flaviaesturariibacter flavus]TCJ16576.1 hypothetical protein EPD60_07490 [Flaviaesturariibacter flavus]